MKSWILVISKEHVLTGVDAGAIRAKPTDLQLLRNGDLVFCYSPGTLFRAGEILQAFTAVVRVTSEAPHRVDTAPTGQAWHMKATFLACDETPIEPLIPQLDFIQDTADWARFLPRGLFAIDQEDATRIRDAMTADLTH
jgi:hypothetical protein